MLKRKATLGASFILRTVDPQYLVLKINRMCGVTQQPKTPNETEKT